MIYVDHLFCLHKFLTGAPLVVNSSWKNPTGEWRVGSKLVYQLFTDDLTSRVKVAIRVVIFLALWIAFIYSLNIAPDFTYLVCNPIV